MLALAGTPLTVIGGFLGAGKTSLLNHVLAHAQGVRYGVLVNDFGELAIDDRLVVAHGGDTVRFANGCLCCTLGDNLVETLDRLLAGPSPPEQFLVEASGVADPTLIADVATLHPMLRRDLVVVMCDGTTVQERSTDPRLADTVNRQIAAADLLVLNHGDRLDPATRLDVTAWLEDYSRVAVVGAVQGQIDLGVFDATSRRLDQRPPATAPSLAHPFHTRVVYGAIEDHPQSVCQALSKLGPSILRAKGIVRSIGPEARWWAIQKTGSYIACAATALTDAGAGPSAIVLLSLDPLPEANVIARSLGLRPEATS